MRYRSKRVDWEWVMCYHIGEWEARNREDWQETGGGLMYPHFAWYHRQEICVRVLAHAQEAISRARAAVEAGADRLQLGRYGEHLCCDLLYPGCEEEFELVRQELADRNLGPER